MAQQDNDPENKPPLAKRLSVEEMERLESVAGDNPYQSPGSDAEGIAGKTTGLQIFLAVTLSILGVPAVAIVFAVTCTFSTLMFFSIGVEDEGVVFVGMAIGAVAAIGTVWLFFKVVAGTLRPLNPPQEPIESPNIERAQQSKPSQDD